MSGAGAEHASDPRPFEERLRALDVQLFTHVPSETSRADRIALLALQNACRDVHGSFRAVEIGSHLGGSLQALLMDDRCIEVTSIDPRPAVMPDVRGEFEYPGNSTERMLTHLAEVPGGDLDKLRTIEAGTDNLSAGAVGHAELCFIDGEHTLEAVLRDAHFCLEVVGPAGVIGFHDLGLVRDAVAEFVAQLGDATFSARKLPGSVYAVEVGTAGVLASDWIATLWSDERRKLWKRPGAAAKPA